MKKSEFQNFMERGAILCLVLSLIFLCCWLLFDNSVMLSLLITFTTIFFHFSVRILIGTKVDKIAENGLNYKSKWFVQSKCEKKLYQLLKVSSWKLKLPTYTPEKFSLKQNTVEQIIVNMCAAELIHELDIVASMIPIIISIVVPFLRDTLIVFVLTSVAASLFDLLFVIIQRYNRPRMLRLLQRKDRKQSSD